MLAHYFASPTVVRIGPKLHLVDRLTLGDYAFLLQSAGDALGTDTARGEYPPLSDPDMLAWLVGPGMTHVFYCSLRRRSELDADALFTLCEGASEDERTAVFSAAMRHLRKEEKDKGDGVDLALLAWGRVLRRFASEGKGLPTAVADYTVEQADLLLAAFDPEAAGETAHAAEMMAKMNAEFVEIQAMREAEAKAMPDEGEVTLAELGLKIVPEVHDEGGGEAG